MAVLMHYQLRNPVWPTFYNQQIRRSELTGPDTTPTPWAPVVEVIEAPLIPYAVEIPVRA
jgi:hypothetical protein